MINCSTSFYNEPINLENIVNLSKQINDLRDKIASYLELFGELNLLSEYQKTTHELKICESNLKQTYGYMFDGLGTNWNDVIEAINWTESFIQLWKDIGHVVVN